MGIAHLLNAVPDAPPYRVWSNFEFIDDNGQWHEVDALVVGQRQVHLVELKNWSGTLTGNEHRWETMGGAFPRVKNPVKLARYKAQRLASRLTEEFSRIVRAGIIDVPYEYRKTPWVKESVFLHNADVVSRLSEHGSQSVFGLDGYEATTGLPGISERLTEGPDEHRHISEDFSRVMLETALQNITGGYQKKRTRHAGSWVLDARDEWDDQVEVWTAHHQVTSDKGFVHIPVMPSDPVEAASVKGQVERTYTMLSAIKHDAIDSPESLALLDDTGIPVLVYQGHAGHESLDYLFPGTVLTAPEQVDIILQISDAISYAHEHDVVHRGLGPGAVTVNVTQLRDPDIASAVKVRNWNLVGTALPSTLTQLHTTSASSDDFGDVFLPPEGFDNTDRRTAELFSVGALAYFILSGGSLPASDVPSLLERLLESDGLDLAAAGATVEEEVRELIRGVTSPTPETRRKTVAHGDRRKSTEKISPVRLFADRLRELTQERRTDDGTDALQPTINGMIDDRFLVEKVSGRGSTAIGLRVVDTGAGNEKRILKVALSTDKARILYDEAETLTDLNDKLSGHSAADRFVTLLEPTLQLPHDRTALLLSDCGEYTLHDVLNMGGTTPEGFWRLGEQLLTIVEALESTGITHRDIKPANLGIAVSGGHQHLSLYDFSLSAIDLSLVEAGTPPYRDPFLAAKWGKRTHFDSSAERYSAAVVLHQLATNSTPAYGDGETMPAATDGSLKFEPELLTAGFTPAQVAELTTFFRSALHGHVEKRPKDATELKELFLAARRATYAVVEPPDPEPVELPPTTAPTTEISSFRDLAAELKGLAGSPRQAIRRYVEHLLGDEPSDPFATAATYAELLHVSTQRISQLPGELRPRWRQQQEVAEVLDRLGAALRIAIRSAGRIATPRQLTSVIAEVLPDDAAAQTQRQQIGLLRILEMDLHLSEDALTVVRRGRQQIAVALALSDDDTLIGLPRALEVAAAEIAKRNDAATLSAEDTRAGITEAAAGHFQVSAADLPVAPQILVELATSRSFHVALTASGELYSRDVLQLAMLTDIIKPTANAVNRQVLQNHLDARFPAAHNRKLPRGAELLALLQRIDPAFAALADSSSFTRSAGDAPSTSLATRQPTATALRSYIPESAESAEFRSLLSTLETQLPLKSFRAIAAPVGQTDVLARKLQRHFPTDFVNLSDAVLGEIRHRMESSGQAELFVRLLALDPEDSRAALSGVVRSAAESVLTQARHSEQDVILLTDVSILADYQALDLLEPWTDITSSANPRSMWVVVPFEGPATRTSLSVDGQALPLTSPAQAITIKDLHD
ncbi:NERD domain-containing protein [Corynebacterium sp.]|uniref:protein kinase domain-containing protein n=1 Tax=Corynebacterium sp. TaxID=1720 RepID=UPI0026DF11D2|nr:NERD domain-containing protein [Corynebacterium sp.]